MIRMSAVNNVPNEGKELKTVNQEAIWALGGQVQFLRHETRKHSIEESKLNWNSSWGFSPSSKPNSLCSWMTYQYF